MDPDAHRTEAPCRPVRPTSCAVAPVGPGSRSLSPAAPEVPASQPSDWNADSATAGKGFACLKFAIDAPQYYQYNFTTTAVAAGAGHSEMKAVGDLDGNATQSNFELDTQVVAGVYSQAPSIKETNPEE